MSAAPRLPQTQLAQIQLAQARDLSAYAHEMVQFGPLTAYCGEPLLPTNTALLDGAQPPSPTDLADTLAFFRERRLRPRLRSLNNLTPETLYMLAKAGFLLEQVQNLYTHDLADLPPLAGAAQLSAEPARWAEVAVQGFGPDSAAMMQANARRESLQRWWYQHEGEVTAVAALSLGAGVASLLYAATLPAYRWQGSHTQLVAARLHAAQRQGADFATAFAAPESVGERNLRRAGFVLGGMRFDFVAQG